MYNDHLYIYYYLYFCLYCILLSICFYTTFILDCFHDNEIGTNELESPILFLKNLRAANINRIIIAHMNINSIRNKIHHLSDMVADRLEIS